jgi:hypothetical protein
VGDVDANPAAVELLSNLNCGAAAAERVEDNIAFFRRGTNNAFQQRFGLLGRVAKPF